MSDRAKIASMLKLQDEINSRIAPEWRQLRRQWYRAIWVECAEAIEHVGWKWWSNKSEDLDEVKLELVDIWHFGLSDLLNRHDLDQSIEAILQSRTNEFHSIPRDLESLRSALEQIAVHSLAHKELDLLGFWRAAHLANLQFDSLYVMYVSKNVLNFFRQDHGYRAGTYRKVWSGLEDNVHLQELAKDIDPTLVDYKERLYSALEQRYRGVNAQ